MVHHQAAKAGDVGKVSALVASSPFLLASTTKDADRYSLLHEAALGDHGDLVSYLLRQGGLDMLRAVDGKGRTPGEWEEP